MQRQISQEELSTPDILRFTGIFTVAFSIVTTLVLLFAVPAMSNYLFAFIVIVLAAFFIMGIVSYAVGHMMSRRGMR